LRRPLDPVTDVRSAVPDRQCAEQRSLKRMPDLAGTVSGKGSPRILRSFGAGLWEVCIQRRFHTGTKPRIDGERAAKVAMNGPDNREMVAET